MPELDKEAIKQLTHLCRIDCTEAEQEALFFELQKILLYIEQLREVNTDDIPSFQQVREETAASLRDDEVGELLNRELFLANAPAQIGDGLIEVPPIFKQS